MLHCVTCDDGSARRRDQRQRIWRPLCILLLLLCGLLLLHGLMLLLLLLLLLPLL